MSARPVVSTAGRALRSIAAERLLLGAIGGYAVYGIRALDREVLERVDARMDRVDRRLDEYDRAVRAFAAARAEEVERQTGALSDAARSAADAARVAGHDPGARDARGRAEVDREIGRTFRAHEDAHPPVPPPSRP